MQIIDFTPQRPANPYDEDAAALKALGVPTPEGKAAAITVDYEKEASARNKFGAAARALGYTARFRGKRDNEDGTITLIYTARELDAPRERKNADEGNGEAEAKPKKGAKAAE